MEPCEPIIVDSFAGGGGASTGIEMALGRSPDIAINHSADALAMHQVNHPATLHLDSNIWDVSPTEVCKGRPVGLFWASPDCKHFSKAKGGKPLDRNIRDLAWIVVRWAEEVRPDVIILENVEEFVTWGPLYDDGRPIVELRGHTFDDWTGRLKRAGYKVQWRELRACDYGAPTIRKRFFMIARRDGLPIVWPKRTHGDPKKPDDAKLIAKGKLKPWRTAAEIIDWSLPCPSIFETSAEIMQKFGVRAVRPLAEATMRRIARGVVRYVLEARKPFIVRTDMASAAARNGVNPVDDPLNTLTTAGSFAVVSPVMTAAQHGGSVRPADAPLHTIAASRKDQNAVIVPAFVGCGGRAGQSAPRSGDEPLGTQTAKADGCVVAAHLTKFQSSSTGSELDEPVPTITANSYIKRPGGAAPIGVVAGYLVPRYGERDGQEPRTRSVEEPAPVIVPDGNGGSLAAVHLSRFTQNGVGSSADEPVDTVMAGAPKFGVVSAFLAQHNSGNDGHDARKPLSTLTGGGQGGVSQQGVVAAHLLNLRGEDRRDAQADEPVRTLSAQGNHAALISGFLTKYYGTGDGATLDVPLHTDTVKDRFGLVTVDIDGQTYAIADIGMRMLTPRERFRAQGFPESYIIDRRPDGSPITATVQGSCCGNSVCPPLAEALVAANCPQLARYREAAE
ncbi:DNA cytosine methyltransferase [Mesorhizobium sp. KR9-304]|uniref:DNA cytosine methyltransferase n=1 Tax=Mesorhizobium sp. KR9-304 TaxID=3156614 RepID=UPI0032B3BA2E